MNMQDIDKLINTINQRSTSSVNDECLKICESGDIAMRCGSCGHYDKMINFCKTEINGDLPHDIYQCPKCQTAIKRYYQSGITYKKIVTIM